MQGKDDSTAGLEQAQPVQESSVQDNSVIGRAADLHADSNTTQKNKLDLKRIEAEMLETQNSCFFGSRKGKDLWLPKEASSSPQQAYSPFSKK